MDAQRIRDVLELHVKWLAGVDGGVRASLRGADLRGASLSGANLQSADLSGANLSDANLQSANLSGANLQSADLRSADLSGADLSGASLRGADLRGASLSGANLQSANLQSANLSGADLSGASLRGADLRGASLSGADLRSAGLQSANLSDANLTGVTTLNWLICPEVGAFHAFKSVRTTGGYAAVLIVAVDADVPRVNGIGSRKCRAERVRVVSVASGPIADVYYSPTRADKLEYRVGQYTVADAYDDDPRVECTGGIHFFMTRREAEEW